MSGDTITAAEESAEPQPERPADARSITLDDGSELVMLPMTWRMMKAVYAGSTDAAELNKSTGEMMAAIEDGVIEAHFKNGRELGQQPFSVFRDIFRAWNKSEQDDALPPANGQPSETPS